MEHKERFKKAYKISVYPEIKRKGNANLAYLFGVLEWLTLQGKIEITITANELAEILDISRAWISKGLKKLQELGYIKFTGQPSKGYTIRIFIPEKDSNSKKSKQALVKKVDDIKSISYKKFTNIVKKVDDIDKKSLLTSYKKFTNIVKKVDDIDKKSLLIWHKKFTNDPQQTPMNTELEGRPIINNNNNNNNNKYINNINNINKENKEKISTPENLKERQLEKLEEQKENTHLREKDKKEKEQLREQTIKEMIQKIIEGYNKEFAEPLGKAPIKGAISLETWTRIGKLLLTRYTVDDFIKAFQMARTNSFLQRNMSLTWLVKKDERLSAVLAGKFGRNDTHILLELPKKLEEERKKEQCA